LECPLHASILPRASFSDKNQLVFKHPGIASAQDTKLFISTGNPDGKLGALSRRPSTGKLETETADDFVLNQTTVITGATITGLISPATTLANITNVEVELYHVFPQDSANPDPLAGKCPRGSSEGELRKATQTRSIRWPRRWESTNPATILQQKQKVQ
jgi:hypothetical protein